MPHDPVIRAELGDAVNAAIDDVAALEDPTERYSEAVDLAGVLHQAAADVVAAAAPAADVPVLPDDKT